MKNDWRELKRSKASVKKRIRGKETSQRYKRRQAVDPVLEADRGWLVSTLEADRKAPVSYRQTARKVEERGEAGFPGADTPVPACVQKWTHESDSGKPRKAFVPQAHGAGESVSIGGERRSHPVGWRVGQAQGCPFSSVLQRSIFPGGLSERAVGNAEGGP